MSEMCINILLLSSLELVDVSLKDETNPLSLTY